MPGSVSSSTARVWISSQIKPGFANSGETLRHTADGRADRASRAHIACISVERTSPDDFIGENLEGCGSV